MNTSAILNLYFDSMASLPPGARQAIAATMAAAGTTIIAWVLYLVRLILREGWLAYRETRKRQRAWHPDPEAERREVAELRRAKARGERAQVEYRLMHDRRQALRDAQARRPARNASKAARAAGVH